MLIKTHLFMNLFFVLLLLPIVEHKILFIFVVIFATYLPDVDSRYSTLGRKKINRILQWFTKHRGVIHSFTFLMGVTFVLVLVFPTVSLGFFLGYGLHLLADSFTREGIRPFYPLKQGVRGGLKTGGSLEIGLMVGFLIADVFLFFLLIF